MSGSAAIQHTCRYPFASQFVEASNGSLLQLATAQTGDSYPYFFQGRFLLPRIVAALLTAVARVVSTRYYMPHNMLQRVILERDPVVTSSAGMLRVEGFSACCSTYARVDLTPEAFEGEIIEHGTTNVDFNPPMRAALARVRESDRLTVSVGPDQLLVNTFGNSQWKEID